MGIREPRIPYLTDSWQRARFVRIGLHLILRPWFGSGATVKPVRLYSNIETRTALGAVNDQL